jgi:periodic tryptophan protein 1
MLPNFPLCLEWLDFPLVGSSSTSSTSPKKEFWNHVAAGTINPEIDIRFLDVLEGIYPDMVLGRPDKSTTHVPVPLGTGKKKKKTIHGAHKDKIKNPPSP